MADPPPSIAKPVVLVGLMGAGKSTVGRRLARRLALPFADADAEIEREERLDASEIFARFGEAHFRAAERRVMARLAAGPPLVIAAGGGAFIDAETRGLVLERCLAIWLDAEVDALAERVGRSGHRPLLDGADARARLAGLAERRNPIYALAPVRVPATDRSPDELVDDIVAALARTKP